MRRFDRDAERLERIEELASRIDAPDQPEGTAVYDPSFRKEFEELLGGATAEEARQVAVITRNAYCKRAVA